MAIVGKRIINLGGGTYNQHIAGDYIQGDRVSNKEGEVKKEPKTIDIEAEVVEKVKKPSTDSEVINTNGENYTEHVSGSVIQGDVINRKKY